MPTNSVTVTLLLLGLVAFFGMLTFLFGAITRTRKGLPLRPIPAYLALPKLQSRSIEAGQGLHISLGTAGIGSSDTAATLAGLSVLETVAEEAAASGFSPTITVADPTTLILAQDAVRRSYVRQHNLSGYDPRCVHFVAASPMPYAAAVMDILASGQMSANVMVGAFGPEAAMIVEGGARRGIAQVAGTSDVTALPLLYPSADHVLIGEEMFVSGAYTTADPPCLSSVIAQDIFRWVVVLLILLGSLLSLARM